MFEDLKLRLKLAIGNIKAENVVFTQEEIKGLHTNKKLNFIRCKFCKKYCTFDMFGDRKTHLVYFAYVENKECEHHIDEFMRYKNAEKI